MYKHTMGLDYVYLFVSEDRVQTRTIWDQLGFVVERYAYFLERRLPTPLQAELPEGYDVRSIIETDVGQIGALCNLLNVNFSGQPGHVETTPEYIAQEFCHSCHISGGMLILYHGRQAVGTVEICLDEQDPSVAAVEMLSVRPDYRGRGLGRVLVRKAIEFAFSRSLYAQILSVSAENEAAIKLYLSEGFEKKQVIVCYGMKLGNN